LNENWKQIGRLPPEKKAEIMMDMTSASVHICMDGIRHQNPEISDNELLTKLRERVQWRKQAQTGKKEDPRV
jgi:hypothetical protein